MISKCTKLLIIFIILLSLPAFYVTYSPQHANNLIQSNSLFRTLHQELNG
jgi:hypothetical protein